MSLCIQRRGCYASGRWDCVLQASPTKLGVEFRLVLFSISPIKDRNHRNVDLANQSVIVFNQNNSKPHVTMQTRDRNSYNLVGMSYYTHCTYLTLHLQIIIYFDSDKMRLMENLQFSGSLQKSFRPVYDLLKYQVLGKTKHETDSKMGKSNGTK